MATRGDIRDAFYDRLVSASSGTFDVEDASGSVVDTVTVDADNVGIIDPERETLPQVVYDENYMPIVYNGGGRGPDMISYNPDDTVNAEIWRDYTEAQFTLFVRTSKESVKEPIYESIHESFGKLGFGPWPTTDLHDDVTEVRVEDASSVDTGDEEDVIRGDQLEIYVIFHRDYPLDEDNIEQVESDVEGSNYQTT